MDVSKGGLVVISDVSYILSIEIGRDIELGLKNLNQEKIAAIVTIFQSAESASP